MVFGQFNDSFPPVTDGVARVCLNYSMEINSRGDRCVAVTPRIPGAKNEFPFEHKTFQSFKVPRRTEYRWGVGALDAKFWNGIKDIPFDLVHTHCPFSSHHVAKIIAKRRNIPLVTTFHSKYRDDFSQELKSKTIVGSVVRYIVAQYNDADEVWVVNDSSIETLREYGYKGDVHVIENGCDIQPEDPTAQIKKEIFSRYSFADAPLFIYIGQHIAVKNLGMLLEAITALKKSGARFNMLFIGDGNYKKEMEQTIKRNSIGDCVKFAGIVRDRDLVKKIYLSATAMAFPSLYDTSSLVAREAAACLCPTIFIEGSSTAQGIVDGANGFLSGNSSEEYAAKMKFIIDNPIVRRKAAHGARDTLYRPWSQAVDNAYERYQNLISKKKKV